MQQLILPYMSHTTRGKCNIHSCELQLPSVPEQCCGPQPCPPSYATSNRPTVRKTNSNLHPTGGPQDQLKRLCRRCTGSCPHPQAARDVCKVRGCKTATPLIPNLTN